jgi:replicative DNA helicase
MIDTSQIEKFLVGSALLVKHAFPLIRNLVRPEDMSVKLHRQTWECMDELYLEGKPIDMIAIFYRMGLSGEDCHYLNVCANMVNSTANLEHHCQILIDAIIKNEEVMAHNYASSNPKVVGTIEWREKEAKRIERKQALTMRFKKADGINHQISVFLKQVDKARTLEGLSGITTGNDVLDRITGGWQKEYVVIAARPSMGKTAKMLDYVYHACNAGHSVYVASLEMKASDLVGRLASRISGYNSMDFKTNMAQHLDQVKINEAASIIGEWDLKIDDRPRMSMDTISAGARAHKRESGKLDMIFIDHLQIIATDFRAGRSRVDDMTEISGRVQVMVKEFDCPVIVMCQLSRECEKRSDKRPVPSDLRDSGAIEQDADLIMALYRPKVYYEEVFDDPDYKDSHLAEYHSNIMEILVRKNRNGEVKSFRELVDLRTGYFEQAPRG